MLPWDTYFYLVNIGIMMCPALCYSGMEDSEFFREYPETRRMNGQPWDVRIKPGEECGEPKGLI